MSALVFFFVQLHETEVLFTSIVTVIDDFQKNVINFGWKQFTSMLSMHTKITSNLTKPSRRYGMKFLPVSKMHMV